MQTVEKIITLGHAFAEKGTLEILMKDVEENAKMTMTVIETWLALNISAKIHVLTILVELMRNALL